MCILLRSKKEHFDFSNTIFLIDFSSRCDHLLCEIYLNFIIKSCSVPDRNDMGKSLLQRWQYLLQHGRIMSQARLI